VSLFTSRTVFLRKGPMVAVFTQSGKIDVAHCIFDVWTGNQGVVKIYWGVYMRISSVPRNKYAVVVEGGFTYLRSISFNLDERELVAGSA
jgi:hypothetical protein